MHYRRLGRTEWLVSEIGFGASRIRGADTGAGDGPPLTALRRALDLGVNFFDTADVSGHGRSEEVIGAAFKGVRENVLIATKAGYDFYEGDGTDQNFEPAYIRSAVEQSLRRLNSDYIDLLQLHDPHPEHLTDDLWQCLDDLQREGLVRAHGVAAATPAAGIVAVESRHPATVQVAYNLLDTEAEHSLFTLAQARDVGVIVRSPLAFGFLSDRYGPEIAFPSDDPRSRLSQAWVRAALSLAEELGQVARELGPTPAQLALAWSLSHPAVATAVPGTVSSEHVEENASVPDLPPLTEALRERLAGLRARAADR